MDIENINTNIPRINSRELLNIERAVKIESEHIKNDTEWKSCCLVMDRRFVVFITQFSISLAVLFFSMYKLLTSLTCDETQVYIGLLTMIIGVYMPQPTIKNNS